MKADTGATSTYVKDQDKLCTINTQQIHNGPLIQKPDKSYLQITKKCTIPMNEHLTSTSTSGYIVPGLKNASLLSIGKLCDDGCIALFTKKNMFVFKSNQLMLQVIRF